MLGNPTDMYERFTVLLPPRTVLVQVSDEMRDRLERDWSEPVRIRIEQREDGAPEMVVQRVDVDE